MSGTSPRVLGVIPARGGSKRIPRKNLYPLCGKPLIEWTIEAAIESKLLTMFVVSTEDQPIARVASRAGAFILSRPSELAEDHSTTGEVLKHALEKMGPCNYDIVVCLHPTSPIRDPDHIDQAITRLAESDLDYLASVYEMPSKPHRTMGLWSHGFREEGKLPCGRWDGMADARHKLNASIYAIKVPRFMSEEYPTHVWSPMVALEMDRAHSVDIDEPADLALAEFYLKYGIFSSKWG